MCGRESLREAIHMQPLGNRTQPWSGSLPWEFSATLEAFINCLPLPAKHSLRPRPQFFFPTRIGFHPPSHIAHPAAGCPSRTLVGWVSPACLCLPRSLPAPAEPASARAFSQLGGWCTAAWGWLWNYPVAGGIPTQESFSGASWVLRQELI